MVDNWIEMPAPDEPCEVFVEVGLGYTDTAFYVEGKWYAYNDNKRTNPLNVSRWKKN